jgi:Arc/MetJ family transcription regulator
MRTNIEIDDRLMKEALRASGLATKRSVVEEGLRLIVKLHKQRDVGRLYGKLKWSGDLERSRRGRSAR